MAKEKKIEWAKRILVYVAGMFLIALGVNIAKKSNWGVSPVNAIPFVISGKFPVLTDGTWVIIIFSAFVLVQWLILGKDFKWYYVFQVAVSTLFGVLVDGTALLTNLFVATSGHVLVSLLYILISMVLIAIGIMLYLEGNIMSMPGEGVTVAMTKRFKMPLSKAKLIFDVTITLIATLLSFLFFGELKNVGIGTVLIAFGVGLVMKPLMKACKKPLTNWVYKTADNT